MLAIHTRLGIKTGNTVNGAVKRKEWKMNEHINDLLQLIKDNPDLPILPMVNYEIVSDDCCSYWVASWGTASVTEYVASEERIWFKDEDDMDDVLERFIDYDELVSLTDEQIKERYSALPWVRCIAVYIEMP